MKSKDITSYIITMKIAEKMLKDGLISKDDYAEVDEILNKKYAVKEIKILVDIDLI